MTNTDFASEFVRTSQTFLADEYVPKIRRCLALLDDEQVWWRPNAHLSSVANLVLHLCGNIRQYVVSGIGGAEDVRQRDHEFAATNGYTCDELESLLTRTIQEVSDVLERLSADVLTEQRTIQGRDKTVFEALYHAVEHFSMHTGQIIQLTKQITDRDLGFYRFEGGRVHRAW